MRLLISLFLTLCLLACAQAKKDPYSANDLLNTLNVSVRTSYEQDKTILLYAYEDSVENSEAYADWAAYLNDFSEIKSDQLDAVRVSRLDFEQEMISFLDDTENNFTLFLKKDMPIYYYGLKSLFLMSALPAKADIRPSGLKRPKKAAL